MKLKDWLKEFTESIDNVPTDLETLSAELEFALECINAYGDDILTGNVRHVCPDWDFLPIDDTCSEFEACTCFKNKDKKVEYMGEHKINFG